MSDCITKIQRILFDISDEQVTKVTVTIDFTGDCGVLVKRVYEKIFPARIPLIEIMSDPEGVPGYLLW